MSNHYAWGYLIGALFNLALAAAIYWRRPDLRREMSVTAALAVLIGLPHEYLLWTRDWWHPPTLTGTVVGFEDVLYAIGTGGIMAAVWAFAIGRRYSASATDERKTSPRIWRLMPLAVDFLLPLGLVPLLGMHSFVACGVGVAAALALVFVQRPDLIPTALGSALLAVVVSLPGYWLLEWVLPGFIAATWDLPKLSGVLFYGIPIEDLAWYAYAAAFFGVYYKYYAGLVPKAYDRLAAGN